VTNHRLKAVALITRRGYSRLTCHAHRAKAESLVREAEAMGSKSAAFKPDTGNIRISRSGTQPKRVHFRTQKLLPLMRDGGRIVNIFVRAGALQHDRYFSLWGG
jgi:hypothetical protein